VVDIIGGLKSKCASQEDDSIKISLLENDSDDNFDPVDSGDFVFNHSQT
jgi:hypothetical protein